MDNHDLFAAFSSSITIVSSVVAIAAVSICTIISSVINQIGAKKVQQTELFFHQRSAAYTDLIEMCNSNINVFNPDHLELVTKASARALLFASARTRKIINDYTNQLVKTHYAITQSEHSADDIERLSDTLSSLEEDLIVSMQKDLRK